MSENPKNLVPKFFSKTGLSYDKIVGQTTFGKDKYWKNEIIKKIPQSESILDLACGTGILTELIAKKYPDAKIVGVDITQNYLEVAKRKLSSYKNVTLVNQDAEKLNLNYKFDCITSSYIPKYCKPETLIKSCLEHLKPNGKIILHDFTYPTSKILRIIWNLYFVVLNGFRHFIPNWKDVFEELPKLIKKTKWLDDNDVTMKSLGLITQRQYLTWRTSTILTGVNKV
jgi:demethylmenaquinone methyltransferase / 2-methoxy-6-polyprenyl-1,4-benzoquinol methylase